MSDSDYSSAATAPGLPQKDGHTVIEKKNQLQYNFERKNKKT